MKSWRVIYTSVTAYDILIDAETEDEAMEIARETDGGEFAEIDIGDWEFESVEYYGEAENEAEA